MKYMIKAVVAVCLLLSMSINAFGAVATNAGSWAVDSIQKAYDAGFVPDVFLSKATDEMTREEFCQIAVLFYEKITGEKHTASTISPFQDTNSPEIIFAVQKGMINGITPEKFQPIVPVTREQTATIIFNTLKAAGMDVDVTPSDSLFTDVAANSYAIHPIQFLYGKKIISGYEGNLFKPKNHVTVQEAIVAFENAYEAIQKNEIKKGEAVTAPKPLDTATPSTTPATPDTATPSTTPASPNTATPNTAPASPDTTTPSITTDSKEKTVQSNENIYLMTIGDKEIKLGQSLNDLVAVWGNPDRIDKNGYNQDRYIYLNGYADLLMVTVVDNKVTEIYTGSQNFNYMGVTVGSHVDDIENLKYWDKAKNKVELLTKDEFIAYVHLDNNQMVDGIIFQDLMYSGPLDKRYNQNFETSTVLELYDLINSIRVRNGQSVLTVDNTVAAVAAKHCFNMSKYNFIAYNDQLGKTPFDRIKDAGINFAMAAETIGKYEGDAISIYHELISNIGTKSNLLNLGLDHIGIGIFIDNYSIYATADLYRAAN